MRSAYTVCVAPLSKVSPQWDPSVESPSFHQPASEFAHQFQPTRTSSFSRQNSFQSAHCARALSKVLHQEDLPLLPASMAISPTFTLTLFLLAQLIREENEFLRAVAWSARTPS